MNSLGSLPFLRITCALAIGIAAALFLFTQTFASNHFFALAFVAVLGILLSFYFQKKQKSNIWAGAFLQLALIILGFVLGNFSNAGNKQSFFGNNKLNIQSSLYLLRLDEEPSEKPNTWRCAATVLKTVDSNGSALMCAGRLLIYWPKKYNAGRPALKYGDEILVPNAVIPMPSAAFPDGFDFKAVMRYRNMQHQLFLKNKEWMVTANSAHWLFRNSYTVRDNVVGYFQRHYPKRIAALLESLLIGFKDDVDPNDLNAFAISGTLHVLAVSGMHVGLLYLVLLFMFTGKRVALQNPFWRGFVILLVLWAFAVLTGLSASVIRAALMFSIVELGRSLFKKEGNILNSLFAAAFLQLLVDPLQLIDVGFQLSYLAVIGIVVIYPKLSSLWMPPTAVAQFFYQSALISLAATLATFPISLYFFGVFPTWFLFANMIIVPLSTFLILLTLVSLLFTTIPIVSVAFVWAVKWTTLFLLSTVHFFSDLTGASLSGLQLAEFEVLLLLAMVVCLCLAVVYRVKNSFLLAGCFAVLFGGGDVCYNQHLQNKSEIVFAEIRGNVLVLNKFKNQADVYTLAMQPWKAKQMHNFIKSYLLKYRIQSVKWNFVGNINKDTTFNFGKSIAPLSIFETSHQPGRFAIQWQKTLKYENTIATWIAQKRYANGLPPSTLRLANNYYRIPLENTPQNKLIYSQFYP